MRSMTNTSMIVYSLDTNDTPFYVGITKDIKNRMWCHRSEAKYSENGIYKKFPQEFTFSIIDTVPTKEWQFWEKHYISLYKSWGLNLLNTHVGGKLINTPKNKPSKLPKIPVYLKCFVCDTLFEKDDKSRPSKYCSRKCSYKYKYEKNKAEQKEATPPLNLTKNEVTTIQFRIYDFTSKIKTTLAEYKKEIETRRNIQFPITKISSCCIKLYLKNKKDVISLCDTVLRSISESDIISFDNINPITINVTTKSLKKYCDVFLTFK
jgi:predicted GIY-YIG superfamily endonuclease